MSNPLFGGGSLSQLSGLLGNRPRLALVRSQRGQKVSYSLLDGEVDP